MEIKTRKAINDSLKKYCYLAKENDFIEVTQWTNGEGYTINISNGEVDKTIDITSGELEAIVYLTMALQYEK